MQTVWKIVYLSYNTSIHLFTKRLWKVKTLNVVSGRQTNLFNTNAATYKMHGGVNIFRSVVILRNMLREC